ncbi:MULTISPECIES: sugar O-acetyltransferase [Vibrio]|uniref:Acetyltransferase n=2 Tax=Vibrio TaxID=662 RepID=A0A7X4RV48_9VIBR|nr:MULTISPECIES: sugar O-acetyltransferase [Vibrio]MBF9000287.1 sugar O-acetyltransferase [Vibrio nitrifigilis]MZI94163.1 maltose O-acetyltransferase [Vibrio eleionomae]
MCAGELYLSDEQTLVELRARAEDLLDDYNQLRHRERAERKDILRTLFGGCGEKLLVRSPFMCDYGANIHVGENFYMNTGGVILDCAKVTIGDNCLIGPQVGIYTAGHPLDLAEREVYEFAKPITIGDDCWIGGHATINPGVTLGNNVVVASGSVVTKSFPDNVVIAGNPAKILRHLEQPHQYQKP